MRWFDTCTHCEITTVKLTNALLPHMVPFLGGGNGENTYDLLLQQNPSIQYSIINLSYN